jgi:hypothetical protein
MLLINIVALPYLNFEHLKYYRFFIVTMTCTSPVDNDGLVGNIAAVLHQ